ncbi:MAG: hypothetical protein JSR34_08770 [Proteobacteria bacterium]|nr:hypothetical protein [Pseudomonadota bacterium]
MKSPTARRNHPIAIAFIALMVCAASASPARTLEVRVQTMQSPLATARSLTARLVENADALGGRLQVDVASVDAGGFGYTFDKLHWECALTYDARAGWICAGDVRAGGGKPMRLAIAFAPTLISARLSSAGSAMSVRRDAASPDVTRLLFEQVPVAWLQAYAATLWKDGRLQKGSLDGQLDVRAKAASGVHAQGSMRLRGLALETPGGAIATDGLDLDAKLSFEQKASVRKVAVDASLAGGQLLAGGLYAALPKTPILASVRAQQDGGADWNLSSLGWNDGAVLTVTGGARWSPAAGLRALELQLQSANLATVRDRYLSGWLDPAGLAGVQLAGAVQGQVSMDASGWRAVAMNLRHVDAIDSKQRFALRGVDGSLHWASAATSVDGGLRWNAGALFGIALGPAAFKLASHDRHLTLSAPASIPMLGGSLRLDRFDLVPPDASTGARFVFGVSLQQLQVAQLAKALGWPAFGGTLDGSLPSAHYADNQLVFDGALQARVFDGSIAVTRLSMDRPFGVDPGVSADVDIKGLDLKALTGVFGFGQITGRLDGSIRDLRLLDWTPIAFDARLYSDDKASDRRRISRRAVADLSNVGGAGIGASLQAQALKLFQDFGYARLGISCRLANNVCHVDGVGSAGSGYTIVEGSGLPNIRVIGFERKVDWPTLVARLKAATQGEIVVK